MACASVPTKFTAAASTINAAIAFFTARPLPFYRQDGRPCAPAKTRGLAKPTKSVVCWTGHAGPKKQNDRAVRRADVLPGCLERAGLSLRHTRCLPPEAIACGGVRARDAVLPSAGRRLPCQSRAFLLPPLRGATSFGGCPSDASCGCPCVRAGHRVLPIGADRDLPSKLRRPHFARFVSLFVSATRSPGFLLNAASFRAHFTTAIYCTQEKNLCKLSCFLSPCSHCWQAEPFTPRRDLRRPFSLRTLAPSQRLGRLSRRKPPRRWLRPQRPAARAAAALLTPAAQTARAALCRAAAPLTARAALPTRVPAQATAAAREWPAAARHAGGKTTQKQGAGEKSPASCAVSVCPALDNC